MAKMMTAELLKDYQKSDNTAFTHEWKQTRSSLNEVNAE